MTFIDRLDDLMRTRGINKSILSKESGIPYTTIVGFYAKGTDNVKLSTLKKLSSYFGCSIDYLAGDDDTYQTTSPITGDYTPSELEEIKSFAEYVRGKRNRQQTPPPRKSLTIRQLVIQDIKNVRFKKIRLDESDAVKRYKVTI